MSRWTMIAIAAVLFGLGSGLGIASYARSSGAELAAADDPVLVLATARDEVDALLTAMNDVDTSSFSLHALAAVKYLDISNRGKRVGLSLLYDHTWAAGLCDYARFAYARAARMYGLTATYFSLWYEVGAVGGRSAAAEADYFDLIRAAWHEGSAAPEEATASHEVCLEQRAAGLDRG